MYVNTLRHEFVYDDLELILNHPLIRQPWNLPGIVLGTYWGGVRADALYRPLTIWTLALNYGANVALGLPLFLPFGFHLVNLLLHAAVGCLFFRILQELRLPLLSAFAAALLFVAHPIHTEAVAAIVGRAELLAALFGLLFVLWHWQGRTFLACGAYLLTMWGKESGVAFLGLVLLADVLLRPAGARRLSVERHIAYLFTLVGWFLLRALALRGTPSIIPFVENPLAVAPLPQRLLTAARVQVEYVLRQIVPVGLSSDYSYNQIPLITSPMNPYVLAFLIVAAGAAVLAWRLRKPHPIVPFALGSYAVLFTPTSNFIVPIGTIMGERLAYAPSLMVCLLAGYGLWRLYRRAGNTTFVLLAALLIAFGALTVARNRTWADELTFYRAQLASAPQSAITTWVQPWPNWVTMRGPSAFTSRLLPSFPTTPRLTTTWGMPCAARGPNQSASLPPTVAHCVTTLDTRLRGSTWPFSYLILGEIVRHSHSSRSWPP